MSKHITVRFDKNAVLFFDKRNGTKLRLALGKYDKASKPELVDMKLTDFCSFGCTFCYQGSTLKGKHASMENIEFAINEFKKVGVCEIAFGGGEILEMDNIVEIIQKVHASGIVPNFTTKLPGRVRAIWDEIGDLIGGFAYSAETSAQVESFAKLMKAGGIPTSKMNLHYVMGLGDRQHFRDYLIKAFDNDLRVTLLGYKTTGRGKDVIPHPYDWWIQEVTSLINEGLCPSLSIDTPMAGQYAGEMPIDSRMFFTSEGQYSMYLDAVSMKFGASSFDALDTLRPFDKNWRKTYRRKDFAQSQLK